MRPRAREPRAWGYGIGGASAYRSGTGADRPMSDRAHLLSTDAPKALRVAVTYKEDLRRGVTLDWQRELVPRFQPAATSHLHSTFLGLRHGDVVLVEFVPQRGTTIRVNRSEIVTGASHDVILTFLDHWIGQRPVSDELKRSLLGSS